MDVYERLTQDHRKARDAITELKRSGEVSTQDREAVFRRLKRELEAHAAFEEEAFYPAAAEDEDSKDAIDEALAEHDEASALLEELDDLDKDSEEFDLRLAELEEALEHHIRVEETEIFAAARETISPERSVELARRHEAASADAAAVK